uniref:Uncharacterized protein n=1 Tax=Timema monikensis TaxID=170555 RepID=A0A7R9DZK0_9NEOP|nr:unnamed protein product [Timema monikensis]
MSRQDSKILIGPENPYVDNCVLNWGKKVPKENDGETVPEAAPAIDNWEEVTSDTAISDVDFVSVDEDVEVCGEVIDTNIVAKVLNNNIQAKDGASADEEYNSSVFQERLIPSAAEAMDHIQELRDFFESFNNSNYAKFLKTLHSEQVTKLQAKNQHECDLLEDIRAHHVIKFLLCDFIVTRSKSRQPVVEWVCNPPILPAWRAFSGIRGLHCQNFTLKRSAIEKSYSEALLKISSAFLNKKIPNIPDIKTEGSEEKWGTAYSNDLKNVNDVNYLEISKSFYETGKPFWKALPEYHNRAGVWHEARPCQNITIEQESGNEARPYRTGLQPNSRNMWNVWRTVLEENEKLARARLAAVEVFHQQIADDAKFLRSNKVQTAKKCVDQIVVIQKELQTCVQDVDKTKKFYFDEEHTAHDVRDKARDIEENECGNQALHEISIQSKQRSSRVSERNEVIPPTSELYVVETKIVGRLKKKKGSFFQSITSLQKNSAKVTSKREALEEKSTGARNDYLLSLASANAHQTRYFVVDLQSTMQTMESCVFEKVAEYLTLIGRTELLTCSATQNSFGRIRDQAQQVITPLLPFLVSGTVTPLLSLLVSDTVTPLLPLIVSGTVNPLLPLLVPGTVTPLLPLPVSGTVTPLLPLPVWYNNPILTREYNLQCLYLFYPVLKQHIQYEFEPCDNDTISRITAEHPSVVQSLSKEAKRWATRISRENINAREYTRRLQVFQGLRDSGQKCLSQPTPMNVTTQCYVTLPLWTSLPSAMSPYPCGRHYPVLCHPTPVDVTTQCYVTLPLWTSLPSVLSPNHYERHYPVLCQPTPMNVDPNDQNGPDLEMKIEELKHNIRRSETAKMKAEARIECLRQGGDNSVFSLLFTPLLLMQSRVTVNVDEWLQDVDNLSVQDMQRSASALSVRTDASGAGEAPSSDSLYDSDFDVGSEVTPMERPDSVELVRDEETDRQDAAEVDAMVEQERQRLEQLTAGWDDPTQVDWGHAEEESFTQATATTVGSETDADSLQQQTPGAAPDTPGMDIVLSYKCIALYNYTVDVSMGDRWGELLLKGPGKYGFFKPPGDDEFVDQKESLYDR